MNQPVKHASLRTATLAVLALGLAGCATWSGASPAAPEAGLLGLYRGSFESALTEDPADDLNYAACRPDADCSSHPAPLADVLMHLYRDPRGRVSLAFFRSSADLAAGRRLDLLGPGCGTRLGPLSKLQDAEGSASAMVARFPLTADNRACLGKLRPTSEHHVNVVLAGTGSGEAVSTRVVIDKAVHDTNYLYVVEHGVRRRVKIDLHNVVEGERMTRYRICIEDDYGEYERCVLTDRRFRSFALPVPVPGGAAISYAWWQELQPRLQRTRGRYAVEQYVGHFERIDEGATAES